MELLEIYTDDNSETHFSLRRNELDFETRNFAPPSKPLLVSTEIAMTTGVIFIAPPTWDDAYHATPRKQLGVVLSGAATVTATDGEIVTLRSGDLLLLNDKDSKGHLTQVQGEEDFCVLLIGVDNDDA